MVRIVGGISCWGNLHCPVLSGVPVSRGAVQDRLQKSYLAVDLVTDVYTCLHIFIKATVQVPVYILQEKRQMMETGNALQEEDQSGQSGGTG